MKELDQNTIESSELVDQTFDFWFNSNSHIRCPFPEYIQKQLKDDSVERFYKWTSTLKEDASKEVNETVIGEKFEEIIFETALSLVNTEDERITVNYPFMPRIGDEIKGGDDNEMRKSFVRGRSIVKEEDRVFLKMDLEIEDSGECWDTKFELPA